MSSSPRRRAATLAVVFAMILGACSSSSTPSPSTAPTPAPTQASQPATAQPTPEATPQATPTPEPTATPEPAVTLTYLVDDSEVTQAIVGALVSAYTAKHPTVTINVETRPQGGDGDNVVKTRLATGEMSDIFFYNSGSLLQALKPTETLVDLSGEAWIPNIDPGFITSVTQNGQVFGAPTGTATGGGILYNKKVFEQAGISVPKTWAEFESNNAKLKAAGVAPVGQTYGASSTWTSQLFVLADYYNVSQAVPDFTEKFTANQAKYATTPAAMAGFAYLREGFDKGWWQKDFATTTFEQGLKDLADGKFAQYPMLSFALSTIATNSPDKINDIGFFGQPGTDASKNGATIWMPAGTYIAKTSKNIDAAKQFLAFIASTEGVDALNAKVPPAGPYVIKGATLPADVLPAVKDIAAYIDAGHAGPALEFLSPVKGPSLEQLCIAVGSGQMDPAKAADSYDKDVAKAAKQMGLPGW